MKVTVGTTDATLATLLSTQQQNALKAVRNGGSVNKLTISNPTGNGTIYLELCLTATVNSYPILAGDKHSFNISDLTNVHLIAGTSQIVDLTASQ